MDKLLLLRPDLKDILKELIPLIPQRKFLTVDYSELCLKRGSKTCRDPRWHVDGVGNDYLIINFGECRTRFLNQKVDPNILNTPLKELNNLLGESLKHLQGEEIPEGVPVLYTSSDIHKGNVCSKETKRILLRLCSSDYLQPKNAILINSGLQK